MCSLFFKILLGGVKMSEQPMYKRVLLKISGEALSGGTGFGINNDVVSEISLGI